MIVFHVPHSQSVSRSWFTKGRFPTAVESWKLCLCVEIVGIDILCIKFVSNGLFSIGFVSLFWRHVCIINSVPATLQWDFVVGGCVYFPIAERQCSHHLTVLMFGGTVCG